MKENGVEVADCSGGIQYNNATYLGPNELVDFFKEDDNG
jgi:hypothetical protein